MDRAALAGPGHLVDLPTHPFQREHYWVESTAEPKGGGSATTC